MDGVLVGRRCSEMGRRCHKTIPSYFLSMGQVAFFVFWHPTEFLYCVLAWLAKAREESIIEARSLGSIRCGYRCALSWVLDVKVATMTVWNFLQSIVNPQLSPAMIFPAPKVSRKLNV
ncbi:hypothetical protein P171DRAFT_123473 [Karstenula rhodostoma CBS 690.94]|uniref:Uncharacterized protein n=1 Tax=Karstenula rhodostoma CBS 690.94 TaxID=1392251 RepID=A0A9P4PA84_9PLEO|nr:hypothetical protein P171DRAFT_123473 [Karstenula rhodostoma CBS 690.94]